jgi:predicted RNA binding protein YcfA (HicA-like mRNA interferase family)
MAKLPSASSSKVVKAFRSFGWEVIRRESSHIIMVKEGEIATLSVPDHNPVAKGTLRSLIRAADLTVQEFVVALRRKKRRS